MFGLKTKIVFSLFFILLLCVAPVLAVSTEGFESGWGEWSSASSPFRDSSLAHSGSWCLHSPNSETPLVDNYVYSSWDLTDSDSFAVLTFWMGLTDGSKTGFAPMYRIRFVNGTTWLDWVTMTWNSSVSYNVWSQYSVSLPSTYFGSQIIIDLTANNTDGTYRAGGWMLDDIQFDQDSGVSSGQYTADIVDLLVIFFVILLPCIICAAAFKEADLNPITGFIIGLVMGVGMGVISGVVPAYFLLVVGLLLVYLLIKGWK